MREIPNGDSSQAAALAAVRDRGRATVTDLAGDTGLSRPTVESALEQLKRTGLVGLRDDRVHAGRLGGRPARAYSFYPDPGLVVGIDLSRADSVVLVADLAGRVLAAADPGFPSPTDDHPGLEPTVELIGSIVERLGRSLADVKAVGLGVGGIVDEAGVLTGSPTLRSWRNVNLAETLSSLIGAPVFVDNDLALAAAGEARLGALADAHCGVYALTWHHVSARITLDGQVLRGRRLQAGEVGLLNSFRDIPMPPGSMLEAVNAIRADLSQLRLDAGYKLGADALNGLVFAMTPGIAALVLAVDPDVVVLGGELGAYADLIAPALAESVRGFASGYDLDAEITASKLGLDAVALGALQQAFVTFSAEIYATAGVPAPKLLRAGHISPPATTSSRSTT